MPAARRWRLLLLLPPMAFLLPLGQQEAMLMLAPSVPLLFEHSGLGSWARMLCYVAFTNTALQPLALSGLVAVEQRFS